MLSILGSGWDQTSAEVNIQDVTSPQAIGFIICNTGTTHLVVKLGNSTKKDDLFEYIQIAKNQIISFTSTLCVNISQVDSQVNAYWVKYRI